MDREKIGKITLDRSYNREKDFYSDGSIENDILKLVQNEKNVYKILENDTRWPVLYHLSPVRQNILEWYPFKENASCLEVGSGCGAITGVLSRKCSNVDCVDLSERRCLINAYRNSDCDNVTIYVTNFNDFRANQKYDYITLIGVLEYAAYYTDTADPFVDFLKNIRNMLKSDGKLLIAIENKYGLKYFNGKKEDHTGMAYEGITGYKTTSSKVRTFSKETLKRIINRAGFSSTTFYYPVPDYKFPTAIYSDEYYPSVGNIEYSSKVYDNGCIINFNEQNALNEIIEDGLFGTFSNSFFVEAGE